MEEHAALSVLQRWGEMSEFFPGALPLVPEHVEIRSLQNQDKPGLPQVPLFKNNNYKQNNLNCQNYLYFSNSSQTQGTQAGVNKL